jgi:hypothetical protein
MFASLIADVWTLPVRRGSPHAFDRCADQQADGQNAAFAKPMVFR